MSKDGELSVFTTGEIFAGKWQVAGCKMINISF